MKRILLGFGVAAVIAINTVVVFSLQGQQFKWPDWLAGLWLAKVQEPAWKEPQFNSDIPANPNKPEPLPLHADTLNASTNNRPPTATGLNQHQQPEKKPQTSIVQNSQHDEPQNEAGLYPELAGSTSVCPKGRYGVKPDYNKVYRWVDNTGRIHLTDTPPPMTANLKVEVVGEYPPDDYQLNISGAHLPSGFKTQLEQKVDRVFEGFGRILDRRTVKDIQLNFRFFTSKPDYQAYRRQQSSSTASAIGFYQSDNNESVVLIREVSQGLETGAHEATHAINRALFGRVARWLNEGLAQYFSQGSYTGRALDLDKESLTWLFDATQQDWDGGLRPRLYRTSHALISYWMSTSDGRDLLTRLLLAEQYNGCEVLSAKDVAEIILSSAVRSAER